MLVRSLPMKSRKGFARDVFETFNTHSCLVRDVTDTNVKAQNGIFKSRREMECKTAVSTVLYVIPVHGACGPSSHRFLF